MTTLAVRHHFLLGFSNEPKLDLNQCCLSDNTGQCFNRITHGFWETSRYRNETRFRNETRCFNLFDNEGIGTRLITLPLHDNTSSQFDCALLKYGGASFYVTKQDVNCPKRNHLRSRCRSYRTDAGFRDFYSYVSWPVSWNHDLLNKSLK